MLTYQLQRRYFRLPDSNAEWVFPNDAQIEFWFEPQEPFGTRHEHSRTTVRGSASSSLYNANNGRWTIRSETPLSPAEAGVYSNESTYDFKGNKLYVQIRSSSQDQLAEAIYQIQGLLPPILNLFFDDPPLVTTVCGKVGNTLFRWELAETEFMIHPTTNEERD